jgi:hypothetical protein
MRKREERANRLSFTLGMSNPIDSEPNISTRVVAVGVTPKFAVFSDFQFTVSQIHALNSWDSLSTFKHLPTSANAPPVILYPAVHYAIRLSPLMATALRANSAPSKKSKLETATHPPDKTPPLRPIQRVGTRRSARLQNKPPDSYVQVSTTRPTPESQLARTKQNNPQGNSEVEAEAEADADEPEGPRPPEQSRSLPPSRYPLSKTNLRIFNKMMASKSGKASTGKRTWSQLTPTTNPDAVSSSAPETATSKRSSPNHTHYRYDYLQSAKVYIHVDPPQDVQAAIDIIVGQTPLEARRAELHMIAGKYCSEIREIVQSRAAEGGFVAPLSYALLSMETRGINFQYGIEWREELKPIVQLPARQNPLDTNQQQDVPDTPDLPQSKRQQSAGRTVATHRSAALSKCQQPAGQMTVTGQSPTANTSNPTPDNGPLQQNDMPPPPSYLVSKKAKKTSKIKTPRPDISVGMNVNGFTSAFISTFSSPRIGSVEVGAMLKCLERGEGKYPQLFTSPIQDSNHIFPFAVVEAKAYSTGKQVFEAQNQAAVSGASALKMQHSLNKLVEKLCSDVQPPLFFSICTEGPYHELWAHFLVEGNGKVIFCMKLLKIFNGVLPESVMDFFIALDNVFQWGVGEFLNSTVDHLGAVVEQYQAL